MATKYSRHTFYYTFMDNQSALLLPKKRFGNAAVELEFAQAIAGSIKSDFVLLCIGSDRVLSDCFGPICGSALAASISAPVFGTVDKPVHKENLAYTQDIIRARYPNSIVLTIDAGYSHDLGLGDILFEDKGVIAASATKSIGSYAGDISVIGITELESAAPYRSIRLSELYYMASAVERVVSMASCISSAKAQARGTQL
ncbi:MAG: spore protease YyaC [Eubacteriaceae bacterium]|nr:spore protease YyaC [Eubacteriaceae bacterium]